MGLEDPKKEKKRKAERGKKRPISKLIHQMTAPTKSFTTYNRKKNGSKAKRR